MASEASHPLTLTLRTPGFDDIDELGRLMRKTWNEAYRDLLPAERSAQSIEAASAPLALEWSLRINGTGTIVADDDGRIVGYLLADNWGYRQLRLDMLYVDAAYQRQGVGTALLEFLLDRFPDMNFVTLEVLEPNRNAVAFYERNGFAICGRGRGQGWEPVPILAMRRRLVPTVGETLFATWRRLTNLAR